MIGHTALIPARYGWMIGLKCDAYQSQSLALYGEWNHNETEILRTFVKEGDTVVDCGANIGAHSISFGHWVGETGRVYAVEPQWLPYLCLCGNSALNSMCGRVFPIRAALGKDNGVIDVPIIDPTVPSNPGAIRLGDKEANGHVKIVGTDSVPLFTLDSLNLERCNLIKVDVEGMEGDVIAGAQETIRKFRPIIWAESLPHDKFKHQADYLRLQLEEACYHGWRVITQVYSPRNYRGERFNPYDEQADHNIFAIPQDQAPPEWVEKAKCPKFTNEPAYHSVPHPPDKMYDARFEQSARSQVPTPTPAPA